MEIISTMSLEDRINSVLGISSSVTERWSSRRTSDMTFLVADSREIFLLLLQMNLSNFVNMGTIMVHLGSSIMSSSSQVGYERTEVPLCSDFQL